VFYLFADHEEFGVCVVGLQALGCLGVCSLLPLQLLEPLSCLLPEMGDKCFGVVVPKDDRNEAAGVGSLYLAELRTHVVVLRWVVPTIVVNRCLGEARTDATLAAVATVLGLVVVRGRTESNGIVIVHRGGIVSLLIW
jgi:hypothetical protein